MIEAVAPDAEHSCERLDVSKRCEHAGVQMIEQMAVEGPETRIISVKGHHHTLARRHQHRVTHRAGKAFSRDLDDLELMPLQVHWMRNQCLVHDDQLDTLSFSEPQWRNILVPGNVID